MAVDSSLLYWDMAISFVLHLVGPLAIGMIFSEQLGAYSLSTRVWILIIATALYSFMVNFGALLVLQTTSCDGLKDGIGIVKGAGISAVLTLFFMWIPSIWEGLRLSISQPFVEHHPLLTAADASRQGILVNAGQQIIQTYASAPPPSAPPPSAPPVSEAPSVGIGIPIRQTPSDWELSDGGRPSLTQGGGTRTTVEEYANQTFREIKTACAYMAAFAGAYGVGIGSRYAVTCKKV